MTRIRRSLTLLVPVVLLLAACGGDGGNGDDPTETTEPTEGGQTTSVDEDEPTPEQLESCLATNGFEPEVETEGLGYGVAKMQLTIEVPGFPVAGGGTLYVFATAAEAEETFADISDSAFAPVERHRNTVLTELGTGALNEEGAEEVRARMEACIGPVDEVGGPEA